LYGLEFQPDCGARALQALRGDSAVIETSGAQAHAAHRQALEQQRIEASPMTTSVDPPPMSITKRLSGLMGLVCATPE